MASQEMTFSANDELPHLNDERYIRFIQDYASQLSHNTHMVLRGQSKGFIACKFSVLSYLLISMVWVDESLPTYINKLRLILKINFARNFSRKNREKLNKPVFNDVYLRDLFMYNYRRVPKNSTEITEWSDIKFEDGVAFFGFINPSLMYTSGEIMHYFIVVKRNDREPYKIISSYGSGNVSYYQFETPLHTNSFIDFIGSLNKEYKDVTDRKRISTYMRYHFLNDKFINRRQENQQKSVELDYYRNGRIIMVQFNNIYVGLRSELESRRIENNAIGNQKGAASGFANENGAESGFANENGAASGFGNEAAANVEFKVAEIVTNTVADNAKRTRNNNNINKQNKPKKTKKNVLNDI